jgi:hypothetical protein
MSSRYRPKIYNFINVCVIFLNGMVSNVFDNIPSLYRPSGRSYNGEMYVSVD